MSKVKFPIHCSQNDEVTIGLATDVRNSLVVDAIRIIRRRSMPVRYQRALISLVQDSPYLRKMPDYILVSTMPRGDDEYDKEAGFKFARRKVVRSYNYRLWKVFDSLTDDAYSMADMAMAAEIAETV